MGCDILVDGYNVIKNNPMFQALEIKELASARDLLVRQLKNRYRHTEHRVIVVFDGNGDREQMRYEEHVCIIFSRHTETADTVIKRQAAKARQDGRKVEMYSDDSEVRYAVTEQGGYVHNTGTLAKNLNAAPRDLTQRVLHRQAIRRMYGIDPRYKAVDEEIPVQTGKKKKKKKTRRR